MADTEAVWNNGEQKHPCCIQEWNTFVYQLQLKTEQVSKIMKRLRQECQAE